jgi:hypothetical protein
MVWTLDGWEPGRVGCQLLVGSWHMWFPVVSRQRPRARRRNLAPNVQDSQSLEAAAAASKVVWKDRSRSSQLPTHARTRGESINQPRPDLLMHRQLKTLQHSPSHQILYHLHGTLNIDKKITNCTVYL